MAVIRSELWDEYTIIMHIHIMDLKDQQIGLFDLLRVNFLMKTGDSSPLKTETSHFILGSHLAPLTSRDSPSEHDPGSLNMQNYPQQSPMTSSFLVLSLQSADEVKDM